MLFFHLGHFKTLSHGEYRIKGSGEGFFEPVFADYLFGKAR